MAGAVISTITALLKDVYLPPVIEQLNNEVLLLSRVERVPDAEIVGNQVVVPLHKGRTGGIGARGELEALPASGNQAFARAVFDLSYQYGRGQVSGVAMAKSKNNVGAFLDVLKLEMDGLRNDLKKDLARQVWGPSDGNGVAGTIAQCGVTTASTTVVLASAEPLRKGHLYVGMNIDIGTNVNADSISGVGTPRTITAVSIAGPSITISGATVTTSAAHFIGRAGNRVTGTATSREANGLQIIVPTAANTFGGIDATAAGNDYWDNLRDTAGGSLTLDNMQKMWNRIRLAGGNVTAVYTTFGMQRAYYGLLQSLTRYIEPKSYSFAAGYEALEFNGQPLIADVDAKFGNLYFLDESHIKDYTNQDWHFLDEDGDTLKWVIGFDAWEFAMAKYFQLGVDRRNVLGVISGLNTSDPNGF